MPTRRGVVLALVLLASSVPAAAAARSETQKRALTPVDLRVEGFSLYKVWNGVPERITISFRVVNASGHKITKPFRTRVSPGLSLFGGLFDYFVTTPSLAAHGTL